jgi:hypothetical protein
MSMLPSPLFSLQQHPSLYPQLAEDARRGLHDKPCNFTSLIALSKFLQLSPPDFQEIHPIAIKILNNELFQRHLGSLLRLKPLAEKCLTHLQPVEEALGKDPTILKPLLNEFSTAHTLFQNQYILEYQQACPHEPYTVLSKHQNSIRIYLTAFYDQLATLPSKDYDDWKQSTLAFDQKLLPLFSRLAIRYLINNPKTPIPEFFKPYERNIEDLRQPNISNLEQKIAKLDSNIQFGPQRQLFNGLIRIVFEEAAKSFALLDQIQLPELPKSLESRCRVVFLAFLRQKNLEKENLPLFFEKTSQEAVVECYKKYKEMNSEEKKEFEKLFLAIKEDSNHPKIAALLHAYKTLDLNFKVVPFHLLPSISHHRLQKSQH